jgi:hypothetical protein
VTLRAPAAVLALTALASAAGAAGAPGHGTDVHGTDVHGLTRAAAAAAVASGALPQAAVQAQAASWCGAPSQTDLVPNAVAGHPAHWVYAIPADGEDSLGTFASVMQTDAEAIDAWWRSQDAARTPRHDLASFSCGLQLDLTSLRLRQSGAQLQSTGGRFAAIADGAVAAGLGSPFSKLVVYYDGPVENGNLCGQGATDRSGFGVAVVYTRACTGVSTAAVAAHELLHALGAVPSGAPNDCPEPDDGHTCNDPNDLMYPSVDDLPLQAKLLDPGRNDYYGHEGAWLDVQDSPWLVQLDRQAPLAVTVSGPGRVESDVPGLLCAQSCSTTWNADTRLTLVGTPAAGAKLVRWAGACTGAATCGVTVTPGAAVSALFAPAAFRLTVAVTGKGSVRSARPGITCRPRCAASFPSYVPLRLRATPAKGWRFRRWAGACRGTKPTCVVPMTAAASARAVFGRA